MSAMPFQVRGGGDLITAKFMNAQEGLFYQTLSSVWIK